MKVLQKDKVDLCTTVITNEEIYLFYLFFDVDWLGETLQGSNVYELPITSSDALLLSYGRIVGARP